MYFDSFKKLLEATSTSCMSKEKKVKTGNGIKSEKKSPKGKEYQGVEQGRQKKKDEGKKPS